MRYHIDITNLRIIGYALNAGRGGKGEECSIQSRGVVTNEDGDVFLTVVDGLSDKLTERMIEAAIADWEIDDLLPEIAAEVHERHAEKIAGLVETHRWFATHRDHLLVGLKHFDSKDYLSANALLYPRIEGLLRTYYFANSRRPRPKPSEDMLTETMSRAHKPDAELLPPLAPKKFSEFLKGTFFRTFTGDQPLFVSRHTLAHGVSPMEPAANQKAALLAVLALHQLTFILR